jgi:hypothetical protein
MIIETPFKVNETKDGKTEQIAEFSTYQKACLYVEQLEPPRMVDCSVSEEKVTPENKPLWDVIQGK